jgi:hypothetical protein
MIEGGYDYQQMNSFYASSAANRLRDINIELEKMFSYLQTPINTKCTILYINCLLHV